MNISEYTISRHTGTVRNVTLEFWRVRTPNGNIIGATTCRKQADLIALRNAEEVAKLAQRINEKFHPW